MQALRAQALYHNDNEYVVKDGEVLIVDEFTGRILDGRRYSEGLHQAIEAKEHVPIREENQTLATITLQNYFRLYDKLAGMTGTAKTEEDEFRTIYALDVVQIPTNVPMVRLDQQRLHLHHAQREVRRPWSTTSWSATRRASRCWSAPCRSRSASCWRPCSSATACRTTCSTPSSTSARPRSSRTPGRTNAVTIATNMAGRGVDIKLGEGVPELGGLYVLGTERHESRRIDNQLRGRSGRQGDNGESRFYLSAEDDLIRLFAGDRMYRVLNRLGPGEGEALEHRMLLRASSSAPRRRSRSSTSCAARTCCSTTRS